MSPPTRTYVTGLFQKQGVDPLPPEHRAGGQTRPPGAPDSCLESLHDANGTFRMSLTLSARSSSIAAVSRSQSRPLRGREGGRSWGGSIHASISDSPAG